jgi:glyoxylase-like metal-dependent hydrolase (beta-lactamase superfamily II)
VWLLAGDPLTLVDTGPRSDAALAALERELARRGVRVEDIELILVTHHHLDHSGLAATIKRRSGAQIALSGRGAEYCSRYHERVVLDREFSHALMAAHGVPTQVVADNERFWEFILDNSEGFDADLVLADGDRIAAGGRRLQVVHRPGHSTTDTLFVDEGSHSAFVGDHLLERVSSNTEIYPVDGNPGGDRPPSRVEYIENLKRTAGMPLERLMTGHGPTIHAHQGLVQVRIEEHRRRCDRIVAVLEESPATAFEIAGRLWSNQTVAEQPLLVVWEVIGHLDLLAAGGIVEERLAEDGHTRRFSLATSKGGDRPEAIG